MLRERKLYKRRGFSSAVLTGNSCAIPANRAEVWVYRMMTAREAVQMQSAECALGVWRRSSPASGLVVVGAYSRQKREDPMTEVLQEDRREPTEAE